MSTDGGRWTARLDREWLARYGASSSVGLSLIEGMNTPGAVGYQVYGLGGRPLEVIRECPVHGRWSFPATEEGTAEADRFDEQHAGCVAAPPTPPRPPNKSRRRA